jgi:hypothetical protein
VFRCLQSLIETYHGVYINVVYEVVCTMTRGGFKKDLVADIEYIVEVPVSRLHSLWYWFTGSHLSSVFVLQSKISVEPEALMFEIKPETLENVKKVGLVVFCVSPPHAVTLSLAGMCPCSHPCLLFLRSW